MHAKRSGMIAHVPRHLRVTTYEFHGKICDLVPRNGKRKSTQYLYAEMTRTRVCGGGENSIWRMARMHVRYAVYVRRDSRSSNVREVVQTRVVQERYRGMATL